MLAAVSRRLRVLGDQPTRWVAALSPLRNRPATNRKYLHLDQVPLSQVRNCIALDHLIALPLTSQLHSY